MENSTESASAEPTANKTRRRWKLRILAIALGLLATIILLEVTFRIYVAARGWTTNCYVPQLQYAIAHPINGYQPAPGFDFQSGTTRIQLNSHGLRSAEPNGERPLVVTLGGSAAFGYLVSDGETAADLLKEKFAANGVEVDVQNGGVPGYNLNQTLVRFRERIAPLKPDYVMLYLGWNDTPYIVSDDPEDVRFMRGSLPSTFERVMSHSVLYGFVKANFLGTNLRLVPPVSDAVTPTDAGAKKFLENLETLAEEVHAAGGKLVVCCPLMAAHPDVDPDLFYYLADDPAHREKLILLGEWVHDQLKSFADARNAIWIDAWIPPDASLLGDAIHLTKKGERTVADLWYAALSQLPDFQPDSE